MYEYLIENDSVPRILTGYCVSFSLTSYYLLVIYNHCFLSYKIDYSLAHLYLSLLLLSRWGMGLLLGLIAVKVINSISTVEQKGSEIVSRIGDIVDAYILRDLVKYEYFLFFLAISTSLLLPRVLRSNDISCMYCSFTSCTLYLCLLRRVRYFLVKQWYATQIYLFRIN